MKNKILKYIFTILLLLESIIFMFLLKKLNILYNELFIVCLAILIIINSLLVFTIFKFGKLINYIISLIISIVMLACIILLNNTIAFVSNMNDVKSTKEYSVIVLSDSSYKNIKQLRNKNVEFLSLDNKIDESKSELDKIINFNYLEEPNLDTMINNLYDKVIDAIVLDSNFLNLAKENDINFESKIKILYTFNLELESKVVNNKDIIKPFIVYISGIDTYGNIKNVSRSDVNIIAVINPKKGKILLLNTPRDYYVQLHNTTGLRDKLTHAGIYGVEMSEKTLEDLYNIQIDYYIRLNFTSFINIMDEIGDIEVYSDTTFKTSHYPNCEIKEGINTLNSACALAYSRERYAYKTGDYHRGENQQEVIKGVVNKLTNAESLLKYNKILSKLDGTLQTNMSYDTITELIKYEIENKKSFEVETISVAGSSAMEPTYSIRSQRLYVTIPNEESVNIASQKVYEYLK